MRVAHIHLQQHLRNILRAPFDRRAWPQRLVLMALSWLGIFGFVGVLALVDLITRSFAS